MGTSLSERQMSLERVIERNRASAERRVAVKLAKEEAHVHAAELASQLEEVDQAKQELDIDCCRMIGGTKAQLEVRAKGGRGDLNNKRMKNGMRRKLKEKVKL